MPQLAHRVGLVLALVVVVGLSFLLGREGQQPVRSVHAHGYVVDLTLEEQLRFPGTTYAFQSVVTEVKAARYVQIDGLEYVYTPVVVAITKMHKGQRPTAGLITLRIFGGTANNVQYDADFAPAPDVVKRGAKLLVLGPKAVSVPGDGLLAMTPNGIHIMEGADIIDATHRAARSGREQVKMALTLAESILDRK
jgi:hypothetical protein